MASNCTLADEAKGVQFFDGVCQAAGESDLYLILEIWMRLPMQPMPQFRALALRAVVTIQNDIPLWRLDLDDVATASSDRGCLVSWLLLLLLCPISEPRLLSS